MKNIMTNCRPLFKQYAGQCEPQPAKLSIDIDGNITTDYEPLGCGMSVDEWNGKILSFRIDRRLDKSEIGWLVKELETKTKTLMTNPEYSEIDCRGGGSERRYYTKKGDALCEEIEQICSECQTYNFEHCGDEECECCNEEDIL